MRGLEGGGEGGQGVADLLSQGGGSVGFLTTHMAAMARASQPRSFFTGPPGAG